MKRVLLFIFCIGMLFSCAKSDYILGGVKYEGIYFETEAGLVEAHNYKLEVPAGGGEYDFNMAAIREFNEGTQERSFGFVDVIQTVVSTAPDADNYYRGTLHLTVPKNNTDQNRSVDVRIYSQTQWQLCAIMTISQEKGF